MSRRARAIAYLTVLAAAPRMAGGQDAVATTQRTSRVVRRAGAIARIAAGEFFMGSRPDELGRAVDLCRREPLWQQWPIVMLCLAAPRAEAMTFCSPERFAPEEGRHRVWLREFQIDRTEVTVAAYARCVRAGSCGAGLIAEGSGQFGGAAQPMVGVTWDDAQAYCHWSGGRLPTEAEWERAARGHDGRMFPWGSQYDPRRANHGALAEGCYAARDGFVFTAPVGSYPDGASPDGLLDMAGNAAEWVADLWDDEDSRYRDVAGVRLIDPRGSAHGAEHVYRGGAYDRPAASLRTTSREHAGSGARSLAIGFRCAYDVVP